MKRLSLILLALTLSVTTLTLSSCSSDSPTQTDIKGTGKISGFVTDSRDGGGIGNIELKIVGQSATTKSAANGSYTFNNLAPGVYSILAKKNNYGYQFSAIVDVLANKTTTLPIDMVPIIGDWRIGFEWPGGISGSGDLKIEDDGFLIYHEDAHADAVGGTWKLIDDNFTMEFNDSDVKLTGKFLTNMSGTMTDGNVSGTWAAIPD